MAACLASTRTSPRSFETGKQPPEHVCGRQQWRKELLGTMPSGRLVIRWPLPSSLVCLALNRDSTTLLARLSCRAALQCRCHLVSASDPTAQVAVTDRAICAIFASDGSTPPACAWRSPMGSPGGGQ